MSTLMSKQESAVANKITPTILLLCSILLVSNCLPTVEQNKNVEHVSISSHLNDSKDSQTTKQSHADNLNITYETKWFTQKVDHFGWSNTATYKQRYLVNDRHWCGKNCPILLYAGNEGDIEMFAKNTGFMWENAAKMNALLVFAEHRFYGQSMPYNIDPHRISPDQLDKLSYLSSEQALADYAELVYAIKNNLYEAKLSPVIVLGGSYGGMLAAWMRMKYPTLVAGALAASAPIFQFPGAYQCNKFMQIVTKDFENYSANCSKSIASSWQIIRDLGKTREGRATLSLAFNTCDALVESDVEILISQLNEIWVNMAMTDYANEATFLSEMPALPIKHACKHLAIHPQNLTNEQLVSGISLASQVYTNFTGKKVCLDLNSESHNPMDVLWDFQSCTEMVMPICSDGVNDMFEPQSFDLKNIEEGCYKSWSVRPQINKVLIEYGLDKNLPSASNIIFSTCSRDPWSAGCPQDSIKERGIHAIKIDNVCHHEDMRASGRNDSDAIKQARLDEYNIITDWIAKHYSNSKTLLVNTTQYST